jgi:hypothetical protein
MSIRDEADAPEAHDRDIGDRLEAAQTSKGAQHHDANPNRAGDFPPRRFSFLTDLFAAMLP